MAQRSIATERTVGAQLYTFPADSITACDWTA